jgi:hypothetical protein
VNVNQQEDALMPFEFPPPLSGSGPNLQVLDPGGTPNTIIDTDDPFKLRVTWSVNQPGASLLGGQWTVVGYAESIGPGQEKRIGNPASLAVSAGVPAAGPARLEYSVDIDVPANELLAEEPSGSGQNSSGVYKLTAIVVHQNFGGPTVLAGFVEGPVIQMRNP